MPRSRSRAAALRVQPEVARALRAGRAVVALESTVITHGLPPPHNLDVARRMEAAVRAGGAVPATIALVRGRVCVGLSPAELERLSGLPSARKCSLRDLPIAMARGEDGGTTVSATLWAAARAGIRVFATGGIGGVHRGHPHDVSSDLLELARAPVAVVCAGAKAILDLPLTLEVLETHGVPVIGYGTDRFPAFYCRDSGLPVDQRCDTPAEVAAILASRDALGLATGLLVAAPVPERYALPAAGAERAIRRALAEAERKGIRGKHVTPFLLARVSEITHAKSREANLALLENNAAIAAAIAVADAAR